MLDFGSGPGTAIWSAKQIWEEIGDILSVEPSGGMTKISEQILRGTFQLIII
jgi:ribosomal protein RSM22 (predicted rRNA methylase)